MVQFRIEKNLNTIATGDDLKEIIFKLIITAEAEGWTAHLVVAARESNPGNPYLLAFSQQFGLAPRTPLRPELERIIRATNSFLDVRSGAANWARLRRRCAVSRFDQIRGWSTGRAFFSRPCGDHQLSCDGSRS